MTPARSGILSDFDLEATALAYAQVELGRTEQQERPTALIVVGQDGAGAGALSDALADRFSGRGGFVAIDAESLRPCLPYFEDIHPGNADLAHHDTEEIAGDVKDHAMEGRRNILIAGVSTEPDSSLALAKELKQAGYFVELHALAVNDQISFERASYRYESEAASGEYTLPVPQTHHDKGFQTASATVRRLEYAGAVDQVTVYNRLNDVIASQLPIAGQVVAGEAFDRARDQLTDYERISLAEKWDEIADSMARRGAEPAATARLQPAIDRAHYTLRAAPAAAASYDYDHPTETAQSQALASRYGGKLETAFRQTQHERASALPELRNAFAAQAAGARAAALHPGASEQQINRLLQDRIAQGLRDGRQLQPVQLRDQAASATTDRLIATSAR